MVGRYYLATHTCPLILEVSSQGLKNQISTLCSISTLCLQNCDLFITLWWTFLYGTVSEACLQQVMACVRAGCTNTT